MRFQNLFSADLDQLKLDWLRVSVQLPIGQRLFIFEAERGGAELINDVGDICIDDVLVEAGECRKSKKTMFQCIHLSEYYSVILYCVVRSVTASREFVSSKRTNHRDVSVALRLRAGCRLEPVRLHTARVERSAVYCDH